MLNKQDITELRRILNKAESDELHDLARRIDDVLVARRYDWSLFRADNEIRTEHGDYLPEEVYR